MKTQFFKVISCLSFVSLLFAFAAKSHAEQETVMVSINKSVPLSEAQSKAKELEQLDSSTGTCYFQAKLTQYIPYSSCENDSTCPYWGVALVDLSWQCNQSLPSLKAWMERVTNDISFTIYSNGQIGPFPIVSGGN